VPGQRKRLGTPAVGYGNHLKNFMRSRFLRLSCVFAFLTGAAVLVAQEGHPLAGSWHGAWGPNAKDRTDITVIMQWDGKEITGMINPGADVIKIQKASLDPNGWQVHFEGDAKDRSGAVVHMVADGKIENVSNIRRTITGTWVQGPVKGDFKVTHDN
jgi:hypothetical protein